MMAEFNQYRIEIESSECKKKNENTWLEFNLTAGQTL